MNEFTRLGLTDVDENFTSPPDFDVQATGGVPAAAITQYERDGAVCLRRAVDVMRLAKLREDCDEAVAHAGPDHMLMSGGVDDPGFFFFEYQIQNRFQSFRSLIWDTPIADYTMAILRSKTLGLYYTNTFVKEGRSAKKVTPWHQDGGYSRVRGRNVINFYIPLDPMPAATTLRFKQGSHAPQLEYRPVDDEWSPVPSNPLAHRQVPHPPMSELHAHCPTIGWPLEPGDALVFSQFSMHAAPGNTLTTRRRAVALVLAGDGVEYDASPGLTNPPYIDPALRDGDSPWGAVFPRLR
jgi:ectoine hydroxylase-related dioxygenase (phytanoyl-CoA dioxygenase family)